MKLLTSGRQSWARFLCKKSLIFGLKRIVDWCEEKLKKAKSEEKLHVKFRFLLTSFIFFSQWYSRGQASFANFEAFLLLILHINH
jgi:hypothetical protein